LGDPFDAKFFELAGLRVNAIQRRLRRPSIGTKPRSPTNTLR
jgi:hypothetical protein